MTFFNNTNNATIKSETFKKKNLEEIEEILLSELEVYDEIYNSTHIIKLKNVFSLFKKKIEKSSYGRIVEYSKFKDYVLPKISGMDDSILNRSNIREPQFSIHQTFDNSYYYKNEIMIIIFKKVFQKKLK